ncbi:MULTISPECIES: hypothetical protein [Bacillaceae]|nr:MULTISPECIES: hypothetical protein [Bacillaceae]MCF7620914.1 hypothetical protein [Peribacillus frigoritolerans]
MNVVEAYERGKEIRKKQDDIIALFIKNIRSVEDMEALEEAEREFEGNA